MLFPAEVSDYAMPTADRQGAEEFFDRISRIFRIPDSFASARRNCWIWI
jgi:hypothetical protein